MPASPLSSSPLPFHPPPFWLQIQYNQLPYIPATSLRHHDGILTLKLWISPSFYTLFYFASGTRKTTNTHNHNFRIFESSQKKASLFKAITFHFPTLCPSSGPAATNLLSVCVGFLYSGDKRHMCREEPTDHARQKQEDQLEGQGDKSSLPHWDPKWRMLLLHPSPSWGKRRSMIMTWVFRLGNEKGVPGTRHHWPCPRLWRLPCIPTIPLLISILVLCLLGLAIQSATSPSTVEYVFLPVEAVQPCSVKDGVADVESICVVDLSSSTFA